MLVELNCETDFVARGDKFKELVNDMAMQIAASGDISVVSVEDVPADTKQKEFDSEMGKEDIQAKPEAIRWAQHCSFIHCKHSVEKLRQLVYASHS